MVRTASRRLRSGRSSRLPTVLALVLTCLVGGLVLSPAPASASRAQHSQPVHADAPRMRPTIVLVHGAWADGSSWAKVTRRLQADGYQVRVPPNPLRNLTSDSETIKNFVATIPGPVILVGHSYGGAVITNAGTGRRRT